MPTKKITIHTNVDLDNLIEEIGTLNDETIFEFIKSIDMRVAEYNFTKKLRDYFVKEIKEEDEANKPIAPIIVAEEY